MPGNDKTAANLYIHTTKTDSSMISVSYYSTWHDWGSFTHLLDTLIFKYPASAFGFTHFLSHKILS